MDSSAIQADGAVSPTRLLLVEATVEVANVHLEPQAFISLYSIPPQISIQTAHNHPTSRIPLATIQKTPISSPSLPLVNPSGKGKKVYLYIIWVRTRLCTPEISDGHSLDMHARHFRHRDQNREAAQVHDSSNINA